jgi:hypothetical protein
MSGSSSATPQEFVRHMGDVLIGITRIGTSVGPYGRLGMTRIGIGKYLESKIISWSESE